MRYQSTTGSSSALSRRSTTSQRSSGFITTTGCFIAGIIVFSTVVLLGLHYSVQIESFLQPSKFSNVYISSGVDPALLSQLGDQPTDPESVQNGLDLLDLGSFFGGKKSSKANDASESGEQEQDDEISPVTEGYGYGEIVLKKAAPDNSAVDTGYGYGEIETEKPDKVMKKSNLPLEEIKEEEGSYGYGEDQETVAEDVKENEAEQTANSEVKSRLKTSPVVSLRGASDKAKAPSTDLQAAAKPKKGKRPKDPYNYVVEIDPDWGVPGKWDLKYIQVMPTKKPLIKKDRRIVLPDSAYAQYGSMVAREAPTGIFGQPRALLNANKVLEKHPLYQNKAFDKYKHSLEDVMYYIKNSPMCTQQPVYITLATVGDDLYWQLIENFVYSLVKFEVSECSLVVCVSDLKCMQMCDDAKFPCFNYASDEKPLPSVMEQIAQVKLLHVPKALNRGVDVFMLDLDVGFLHSPKLMIEAFVATPIVDIFVQVFILCLLHVFYMLCYCSLT